MDRLKGKTAFITGAARGLGFAMAKRFHEEGAEIIINDLRIEDAERAAEQVQGFAVAGDVSSSDAVTAMYREIVQRVDRLDILVNNAGISGAEGAPDNPPDQDSTSLQNDGLLAVSDDAFDRMIAVHLRGTFLCTRGAMPLMTKADAPSVINMRSIMGTYGKPGGVAYCAAKAGIMGFTRALAHETAARGIRVNALAPGFIDTDMTAPLATARPYLESQTPLGRFGQPDDIAWAAVYLASDEARFVTGQVLSPNGGWYMSQ